MSRSEVGHENNIGGGEEEGSRALSLYGRVKAHVHTRIIICVIVGVACYFGVSVHPGSTPQEARRSVKEYRDGFWSQRSPPALASWK